MSTHPGTGAEAQRQQALMAALGDDAAGLPAGLCPLPGPDHRALADTGLRAYRRNVQASLERALQAAFPTVHAVLGDEALATLARDLWRQSPPTCGDLAGFGAELPRLLAAWPEEQDLPWLPDLARLDWAVHLATFAADASGPVVGLDRLAQHDPAQLVLRFGPGSHGLRSAWPVHALWWAHQPVDDSAERAQRFALARQALADGRCDAVLVHRRGWAVAVAWLADAAQAAFTHDLLQGGTLGQALAARQGDFPFEAWLVRALQEGWLVAIDLTTDPGLANGAPLVHGKE